VENLEDISKMKGNQIRSATLVEAINTLASFLAFEKAPGSSDKPGLLRWISTENRQPSLEDHQPVDVIVLCASAVLSTADAVFSAFAEFAQSADRQKPSLSDHHVVLVLCGGIGHSTQLMHEAVAAHPRYHSLADQIAGQPEARILQAIAEQFYSLKVTTKRIAIASSATVSILVEDQSTNCGANASKTREVLQHYGIITPRSIVVSQDPTMCRRTVASFQKVYSDQAELTSRLYSWPAFVPTVRPVEGTDRQRLEDAANLNISDALAYDIDEATVPQAELWSMPRFLDLIVGEIPRLRDDAAGYGPRGKGFISHVDIPAEVEDAWKLLDSVISHRAR
jgi:hypothetical protein